MTWRPPPGYAAPGPRTGGPAARVARPGGGVARPGGGVARPGGGRAARRRAMRLTAARWPRRAHAWHGLPGPGGGGKQSVSDAALEHGR